MTETPKPRADLSDEALLASDEKLQRAAESAQRAFLRVKGAAALLASFPFDKDASVVFTHLATELGAQQTISRAYEQEMKQARERAIANAKKERIARLESPTPEVS